MSDDQPPKYVDLFPPPQGLPQPEEDSASKNRDCTPPGLEYLAKQEKVNLKTTAGDLKVYNTSGQLMMKLRDSGMAVDDQDGTIDKTLVDYLGNEIQFSGGIVSSWFSRNHYFDVMQWKGRAGNEISKWCYECGVVREKKSLFSNPTLIIKDYRWKYSHPKILFTIQSPVPQRNRSAVNLMDVVNFDVVDAKDGSKAATIAKFQNEARTTEGYDIVVTYHKTLNARDKATLLSTGFIVEELYFK